MSMYGVLRAARGRVINSRLVRPSRMKWERQQFLSPASLGAHFGVYESFADARRQLPQNEGFNREALAREYVNVRTRKVFEFDYPVMRWLERALRHGAKSVLDIGGSVGVHYYAYSRYLDMPADLVWEVVEVPEIINVGRALAAERQASPLRFTADLQGAARKGHRDVWIAAGSIQYIEDACAATLLQLCEKRPAHVLLNKLPLYGGEDFVTTQNLGEGSFTPVHIYNRARFIRSIEALGYTLRDAWDVHELSLHIPGHPERAFQTFSGLYFVDQTVADAD